MFGNISLNLKMSQIGILTPRTVKSSVKMKNKLALFTTLFQSSMESNRLSVMKQLISKSLKIEVTSVLKEKMIQLPLSMKLFALKRILTQHQSNTEQIFH